MFKQNLGLIKTPISKIFPTFHIPFMGLGKIAIGLIATGVTVVAVGGIVGGVVASRNAQTSTPSDENGSGDNSGSSQGTGTGSGNENSLDTAALMQVLSTIKPENITLTLKTQTNGNSAESAGALSKKSLVESEASTSLRV